MRSFIIFSIKHSKFFHFFSLSCIAAGFIVYLNARKDFLPAVRDSFITVQVIYPGASPESVREEISYPIEKKLSEIPEIDKASSVSKKNLSLITLQLKRNSFEQRASVFQKVQEKVRGIKFPEAADPPQFFSSDYTDFTTIAIHLEGEDSAALSRKLELSLRSLKGLKGVRVLGRPDYYYLVEARPDELQKRGIPIGEVLQAIRQAIPDIPGGELTVEEKRQNISIVASFDSIEALKKIVVRANEARQTVLLEDLASVQHLPKKQDQIHRLNGQEGIILMISKIAESDVILFNKSVRALVQGFQKQNPALKVNIFNDFAVPVESRLNLLNGNLSYGLLFVVLVLFMFFNLKTTFWTAIGIPVAFGIGALAAILGMGITINISSMIGFIVVVGIIVDDAVVLSENSYRYLENGLSPYDAVVTGMSEVLPSVFFAISTTICAIISMYFVEGKIGEQAYPLITVMPLILVGSLFESVLVLPGHLVHSFTNIQKGPMHETAWRVRFFQFFYTPYRKLLSFLIKHRRAALGGFIGAAFLLTGLLMAFKVPFVFYGGPPNEVIVQVETAPGTPLGQTALYAAPIEELLCKNTNFESVYGVSGQDGDSHKVLISGKLNTGVSPRFPWTKTKEEVLALINSNPKLKNGRFFLLREDNQSRDLIDLTVKGTDYAAVKNLAEKVRQEIALHPNTENPRLSTPERKQEVTVKIDPLAAYAYQLSPRAIAQNLSMAFEGAPARTLIRNGQEIDITLRYPESYKTPTGLSNLFIPNNYARFVSLAAVSEIGNAEAESEIRTENGLYALHVLDPLKNIDVLSNNSFAVQSAVSKIFTPSNTLEAGIYTENEQKEAKQTLVQLGGAAIFGLFSIFILLMFLFGSYLHVLIILSIIPFIMVGVYIGLAFMNLPLTNAAMLGIVFLLGMVVNDGIVILEFLRFHTLEYTDFEEAVVNGASLRLRSIMITTSTTVVGIMPVAFGFAGNEYYMQPMAIAMMFGIMFNSLITLFFIPLLVTSLEKDGGGIFRKSI